MCRWTSFVATDGWCSEVIAWNNYHFGCAFVVYYHYRESGGLLEEEQ